MKVSILMIGLVAASVGLSGCSGFKNSVQKLTGQRKDTTLPGEREEVLPRAQTTARKTEFKRQGTATTAEQLPESTEPEVASRTSTSTGDLAAPCDPEIDANCNATPEEPVADPGGGVFTDPQ